MTLTSFLFPLPSLTCMAPHSFFMILSIPSDKQQVCTCWLLSDFFPQLYCFMWFAPSLCLTFPPRSRNHIPFIISVFTPEMSPGILTLIFLGHRLANFFYKGPDGKYFRFCRPYGLHHNYSTLLLQCANNHRQYVNKWIWLCSNKTLFTKTDSKLDLTYGPLFQQTGVRKLTPVVNFLQYKLQERKHFVFLIQ
jgi:hypothetical protein